MWRGKKNLLLFQFFRRSVRRGETAIPNWRFGTQSQIRMCALASRNEGEERDDDFQAGCSVLGCLVPLLIHWRQISKFCLRFEKIVHYSLLFWFCHVIVMTDDFAEKIKRKFVNRKREAGKFKIFCLFHTFLIDIHYFSFSYKNWFNHHF